MGSEPLKNAKHEHFCQLVSNGESATKAYALAGYSEKGAKQSASRLLTNAYICDRIEYLRRQKESMHAETVAQVVQKVGITKEWVLAELVDNMHKAKAAVPVLDSEGNPTGEYRTNIAAANKALELIGTEIGMFVKRVETGGPGDFEKMTDDELERQLTEARSTEDAARRAIAAAADSSRTEAQKKPA